MTNKNKKAFTIPYIVLTVMFVIMGASLWLTASMTLCGISGCTGGGFGVTYDPEATLWSLAFSGIIAAIPAFIASINLRSPIWLAIGIALLIIMPVTGSLIIGTDLSGYPTRYPRFMN